MADLIALITKYHSLRHYLLTCIIIRSPETESQCIHAGGNVQELFLQRYMSPLYLSFRHLGYALPKPSVSVTANSRRSRSCS